MEQDEIKRELEILQSLGYNSDTILKMVQTAPTLFGYNSEDIKNILNSPYFKLPEIVNEELNLKGLVSAEGLKLPKQPDVFADVELLQESQDMEHSHGSK